MSPARFTAIAAEVTLGAWAWLRRHALLAAAVLPLLAFAYVLALIPSTPTISDVRKAKSEQPTVVLAADGKELAAFKRANREWVKLANISAHTISALIATEDHRFYHHHGIDLPRTVAAALHTLRGEVQGGSTITQQLARNLYPDEVGRAPTVSRKVKEVITALKIESVYSKDEILESYLNTVPFLYNAHGIEMAARTYFDKTGELDVLESATLIGMLKGTRYYKPPEPALSHAAAQTLLDVMRGVIDKGTGAGIRARFGIRADVAGKTGTTQDYTDGWFILMHPQLVAGAWVGFNDNRITMREDWGQGARSALNIVGDFFQQSFKARMIDPKIRFTAPRRPSTPDPWVASMNVWVGGIFQPAPAQQPDPAAWPEQPVAQAQAQEPEPEAALIEVPLVVEPQSAPEVPRAALPEYTRRTDGLPRIIIMPGGAPARVEQLPSTPGAVPAPLPPVVVLPPSEEPPPSTAGDATWQLGASPPAASADTLRWAEV